MTFNVNHPIVFVLVGIIIAAVLGQSIFFLIKSVRRAKATNMDMKNAIKYMDDTLYESFNSKLEWMEMGNKRNILNEVNLWIYF